MLVSKYLVVLFAGTSKSRIYAKAIVLAQSGEEAAKWLRKEQPLKDYPANVFFIEHVQLKGSKRGEFVPCEYKPKDFQRIDQPYVVEPLARERSYIKTKKQEIPF